MIRLTLGGHAHDIPCRWPEVRAEQFPALARAMMDFETGRSDFPTFQVDCVLALCGIRHNVGSIPETLAENVCRLCELLTFPYSVNGGTASLTVCLSSNMIPEICGVCGYSFSHSACGHLETSLTAEQYIDSVAWMRAYGAGGGEEALRGLADTLYPGLAGRDGVRTGDLAAVYYNMRGILDYIRKLDDWKLLFHEPAGNAGTGRDPAGLNGSIYQLVRSGYGSIEQIRGMNLLSYLDIMCQQTVETVRAYSSGRMKPGEIARRMNIPLELIAPYIDTNTQ